MRRATLFGLALALGCLALASADLMPGQRVPGMGGAPDEDEMTLEGRDKDGAGARALLLIFCTRRTWPRCAPPAMTSSSKRARSAAAPPGQGTEKAQDRPFGVPHDVIAKMKAHLEKVKVRRALAFIPPCEGTAQLEQPARRSRVCNECSPGPRGNLSA